MKIDPEKAATLKKKLNDGRTKIGRPSKDGVRKTGDLARIVALPRRVIDTDKHTNIKETSEFFLQENGSGELRTVQCHALHEGHDIGGAFISARVGAGKFLISVLLPTISEEKTILLLVPSSLVETTKNLIRTNRKNWKIRADIKIVGHDTLSSPTKPKYLFELKPEIIIIDEVQNYKNLRTCARAKRLKAYMDAYPETKMYALTGTAINKSILDVAHIMGWCLKKFSPLPLASNVAFEWSKATDRDEFIPLPPGALELLMNDEERAMFPRSLGAQVAVARRIIETPGVIATKGGFYGARLEYRAWDLELPTELIKPITTLHDRWEKPDGSLLASPLQVAQVDATLRLGFYWHDITPAPEEWLEARRLWSQCCHWIVTKSRSDLDSEKRIRDAVFVGRFDRSIPDLSVDSVSDVLEWWLSVKHQHKPKTEPVWLTKEIMEKVAERAKKYNSIIWSRNRYESVGKVLEQYGIPYFGQLGLDSKGNLCDDRTPENGPICLSLKANYVGRNLQAFNHNILLTLSHNAEENEQLAGRTHRDKQESDLVTIEILNPHQDKWNKLINNARYSARKNRQEQKVLYADKIGRLLV